MTENWFLAYDDDGEKNVIVNSFTRCSRINFVDKYHIHRKKPEGLKESFH